MAFDRGDHTALVRERQHERARDMMPLVRLVAGAAPIMEELATRDPHWNRYLQLLQGVIDRWTLSRDAALGKLSEPGVWGHEQLIRLKSDCLVADATIAALQLAMKLPSEIIAGKDEAQNAIAKFEREQERKDEASIKPQS